MPLRLLGTIGSSVQKISGSFESIATGTGTGSNSTITFSSIPSTYQHLQIRALVKNTDAGSGFSSFTLRLNSDSGMNYPYHRIWANGSTVLSQGYAASSGDTGAYLAPLTTTGLTNIFGVAIIDILDYASTTKNKTIRTFIGADANGSGIVVLTSSVWLNTNAVNTISLPCTFGQSWASGTQFALYGIKGA